MTERDDDHNDEVAAWVREIPEERLAEVIGELPEAERLIVSLLLYENLSPRQAAAALGVTVEEAAELRDRAMTRLAIQLGPPKQP